MHNFVLPESQVLNNCADVIATANDTEALCLSLRNRGTRILHNEPVSPLTFAHRTRARSAHPSSLSSSANPHEVEEDNGNGELGRTERPCRSEWAYGLVAQYSSAAVSKTQAECLSIVCSCNHIGIVVEVSALRESKAIHSGTAEASSKHSVCV